MKRFALALTTSFLLSGAVARAQTTPVAFVAVDAVNALPTRLQITGVKAGETAASTQDVFCPSSTTDNGRCAAFFENCERLALLLMTKPGQYLLKVVPGSSSYTYPECKLERVAP
jgi:hypothetical protein